jgi:hypothetical protein
MNRTFAVVVLAGSAAGLSSLGAAQAAPAGVVPVHGNSRCKPSPPRLLRAGHVPLAPLRQDLTGIAHHTQTAFEVESFADRAKLLDGKWHAATRIRKIKAVTKGRGIAHGQVGLTARYTTSFPATKTVAGGKGGSFTVSGHTDALGGGLMGGSAGNDRLPREPVGVGATWRVIDCDYVDEIPAKEVRTYTLRSVAAGVLTVTFRDVVSMDPTRRDLGSQKIGTETVKFRLDSLRGTATGTDRVPLGHALASFVKVVTRVQYTLHAVSPNVPATAVTTRLVDTRTDRPAS